MANKNLKSIKFPNLPDTYLIPQGTVTEADLEDLKENGTVANARQLIPSAMETESVPYNFRTAGGSLDIGDREFDKLVGLSLPWNQLADKSNFPSSDSGNGVVLTNNADGSWTITGQQESATMVQRRLTNFIACSSHKYFIGTGNALPNGIYVQIYKNNGATEVTGFTNASGTIISVTDATNIGLWFLVPSAYGSQINYKFIPQVIDLTQLFGSTIADYIYSLETATAGAGVAWFKKFFPKQYYAYNSGEIESVKVSSHDMVGFNQFDKDDSANWKQWAIEGIQNGKIVSGSAFRSAIIPCLPNTKYLAHKTLGYRIYLASFPNEPSVGDFPTHWNGNNLGQSTDLTTGESDRYLVVWFYNGNVESKTLTEIADTLCVNLYWDGSRNTYYEPYVKHSYALDPIELRGILKLDSNNEPYADGDTYEADGTVTRKYGIVDLGTLNWTMGSNDIMFATFAGLKYVPADVVVNAICPKYTAITKNAFGTGVDKTFRSDNSAAILYFKDSAFSDSSTFKTAMNGVYLVYELATPTTESADPFTDPQTVDNWGTEQYVDKAYTDGDRDVEIPCGHETKYPVNLRDKLETAPNAPTSDGDYIVHCESGQLTYIALGSTTTIQNIISRLEALED